MWPTVPLVEESVYACQIKILVLCTQLCFNVILNCASVTKLCSVGGTSLELKMYKVTDRYVTITHLDLLNEFYLTEYALYL